MAWGPSVKQLCGQCNLLIFIGIDRSIDRLVGRHACLYAGDGSAGLIDPGADVGSARSRIGITILRVDL